MKRKNYIMPKARVIQDDLGCYLLSGSGDPEDNTPKTFHFNKSGTISEGNAELFGDGGISDGTNAAANENTVGWSDDWDF